MYNWTKQGNNNKNSHDLEFQTIGLRIDLRTANDKIKKLKNTDKNHWIQKTKKRNYFIEKTIRKTTPTNINKSIYKWWK